MLQAQRDVGEETQDDAAQVTIEPEDEDLALARVLQEQEQLFLRLRSSMQSRHTGADASRGSPMAISTGTTAAARADSSLYARRDAVDSSTDSASSSQDQSDSPADDDDMEFARKLQEEEDRAHYEHMLQMAGVGTDAPDEEQYLSDDSIDPDDMTYESVRRTAALVAIVSVTPQKQLQALGDTVGVVSRGASHNIMDSLQKCLYAQHRPEHAHEICTEQCTVCCMEFEADDDVCVLDCNHCYHTDCIAQWLKHSKKCPICHKEVAAAHEGNKAEGMKQSAPVLMSKKMTMNA